MSYMPLAEERRLVELAQGRDDASARNTLVDAHHYVVRRNIPRYRNQGVEDDDLFQEGIFGLIRAVEDYDPDKAPRFSTHADNWVKECLRMAVFRQGDVVRAPVGVLRHVQRRRRFERRFEEENGRIPGREEVMEALGISATAYDKTTDAMRGRHAVSIDSQRQDDSKLDPVDLRTERDGEGYLLSETVRRCLKALPPRQCSVLVRHYGIGGREPEPLEKIGRDLGLDKEQTDRIFRLAAAGFREVVKPSV